MKNPKSTTNKPQVAPSTKLLDEIDGGEPEKVTRSAADDLLASLRADDMTDGIPVAVVKPILSIAIRKPRKAEFFRVCTREKHTMPVLLVEHSHGNGRPEMYVVTKKMRDILADFASRFTLVVCINRDGILFLWPLRQPREDGRDMGGWTSSAIAIAELAKTQWLRVVSNMPEQRWDPYVAESMEIEPQWPDLSFQSIIEKAVNDGRIIDSENHVVVRQLLGRE